MPKFTSDAELDEWFGYHPPSDLTSHLRPGPDPGTPRSSLRSGGLSP